MLKVSAGVSCACIQQPIIIIGRQAMILLFLVVPDAAMLCCSRFMKPRTRERISPGTGYYCTCSKIAPEKHDVSVNASGLVALIMDYCIGPFFNHGLAS